MANLLFLVKAVEQDAKKKKVESSVGVANDPDIIHDAIETWTGEEIDEYTFNDDEE